MRHPSDLLTRVKEYPLSNFSHFFSFFFFPFFFFVFFHSYLASSFGHMQAFFCLSLFSFVWQLTSTISNYLSYRKPSIQREFMNLTHMSISESVYDTHSDWIHTNKLKLK